MGSFAVTVCSRPDCPDGILVILDERRAPVMLEERRNRELVEGDRRA